MSKIVIVQVHTRIWMARKLSKCGYLEIRSEQNRRLYNLSVPAYSILVGPWNSFRKWIQHRISG